MNPPIRATATARAIQLEPVAAAITRDIAIPTIGIGASAACDGQVLVIDDLLGTFNDFTPRFVKRYAELGDDISRAVSAYAADVRSRRFPGPEHVFRRNSPPRDGLGATQLDPAKI